MWRTPSGHRTGDSLGNAGEIAVTYDLVVAEGQVILLESIRQNKEERQPYVVPTIIKVRGGAFDTSTYVRVQLNFHYTLENVGDSSAV